MDHNGNIQTDDLRAWGEWEPGSKLICKFNTKDGDSHTPRYLWSPCWTPPSNGYRDLHNTDPFIFGDRFLYSNCLQSPHRRSGLKHLDKGSVIAFGSKVTGDLEWALDTVIVVRDSFPYNPLNPGKALECEVPEVFLNVTGGPLTENPKLKELASNREAPEFRLYRGATPKDPICGMYSFFPALPADSNSSFRRPPIVGMKEINPGNWRTAKGHGEERSLCDVRSLWDCLVAQVRKAGLVLGTRAEMPERRKR